MSAPDPSLHSATPATSSGYALPTSWSALATPAAWVEGGPPTHRGRPFPSRSRQATVTGALVIDGAPGPAGWPHADSASAAPTATPAPTRTPETLPRLRSGGTGWGAWAAGVSVFGI